MRSIHWFFIAQFFSSLKSIEETLPLNRIWESPVKQKDTWHVEKQLANSSNAWIGFCLSHRQMFVEAKWTWREKKWWWWNRIGSDNRRADDSHRIDYILRTIFTLFSTTYIFYSLFRCSYPCNNSVGHAMMYSSFHRTPILWWIFSVFFFWSFLASLLICKKCTANVFHMVFFSLFNSFRN